MRGASWTTMAEAAEESRSLETVLGSKEAVAEFFDSVWQKRCAFLPRLGRSNADEQQRRQGDNHHNVLLDNPQQDAATSNCASSSLSSWSEDKVLQNPYEQLVTNGWNVLINLLEEGERVNEEHEIDILLNAAAVSTLTDEQHHSDAPRLPSPPPRATSADTTPPPPFRSSSHHHHQQQERPLLFKNQTPLTLEEQEIYGGSLFSAFLDGCSIVTNHADVTSPWIAALCNDLQHYSFPHAYANTYLTPPACQTVAPHADDRDVFIIQIHGSKQWTVYQNIPIPYPYPHEQVGKGFVGLPVPDPVLQGPVLIQTTLHAGDVLYMPRGYVHEAQSVADESSFHVTVALATHDWSLAGIVSSATEQVCKSVVDYRMALPRQFGRGTWSDGDNDNDGTGKGGNNATTAMATSNGMMRISIHDQQALQQQIDEAMRLVREKVTARFVHETLKVKFQRHNERACVARLEILERATKLQQQQQKEPGPPLAVAVVVGIEAAKRVNLQTRLRAATVQEKQQAQAIAARKTKRNRAVGLHVREDIANDIIGILQALKSGRDNAEGGDVSPCRVGNLRSLLLQTTQPSKNGTSSTGMTAARAINPLICDLTLLCFARKCVEFGALAIDHQDETIMKE